MLGPTMAEIQTILEGLLFAAALATPVLGVQT
jgi:hypothetical protein